MRINIGSFGIRIKIEAEKTLVLTTDACARREAWLDRAAVQRKTYGTTGNLFIFHPLSS